MHNCLKYKTDSIIARRSRLMSCRSRSYGLTVLGIVVTRYYDLGNGFSFKQLELVDGL